MEEWNGIWKKKFSMKWNMEWKIFSMEWIWNGRNFAAWNMEKSSSIPLHALLLSEYGNLDLFYSIAPPSLFRGHHQFIIIKDGRVVRKRSAYFLHVIF